MGLRGVRNCLIVTSLFNTGDVNSNDSIGPMQLRTVGSFLRRRLCNFNCDVVIHLIEGIHSLGIFQAGATVIDTR